MRPLSCSVPCLIVSPRFTLIVRMLGSGFGAAPPFSIDSRLRRSFSVFTASDRRRRFRIFTMKCRMMFRRHSVSIGLRSSYAPSMVEE